MSLAGTLAKMRWLLPALAVCAVLADEPSPSTEALDSLQRYLETDCETGEEGVALDAVLAHGALLAPALRSVLTDGPDAAMRQQVTETLAVQWEERQSFLESNPDLGLAPEALAEVFATGRGEWIERGLQRFDLGCRERAAIALAAMRTPESLDVLRRAVPRAEPPLRTLLVSLLDGTASDDNDRRRRAHHRAGRGPSAR